MRSIQNCFILLLNLSIICIGQTADVTSTVNVNSIINPKSSLLLGITFDSRSSLGSMLPAGYYYADGSIIPGIDSIWKDFPLSTLRYPANGIMQGFEWKKSVGSKADRPLVNLLGNASPPEVMNFGFDEFMAMTAAKGVDPKEIQIMVPIYDSATSGLTPTQMKGAIPNVVRSNADWVEYANAVNNGSNPGGGVDWAAVRAANGREEPYGIEIWNMGNEPYTTNEYGVFGVNNYITTIIPIIDSMKAIDPTIKISITTTGKENSAWTHTILNSSLLKGKVYAVNAHYFVNESPGGISVSAAEVNIQSLSDSALSKGYKTIIGDYAHAIPLDANSFPTGDPDLAMQWQGANESADFLLMVSQIKNIERMNFWVYGLTKNTWHPIRLNGNGSYTSMPQAELYKKIFPLFWDHSVLVTTTSPKGSDGNSYSVRTGAFVSSDTSALSVIAVNRDKNDFHTMQVNGVSKYTVTTSRLLTASASTSDIILDNTVNSDPTGNFSLPPMSVLILQYKKKTTLVGNDITGVQSFSLSQNYPNPFNPATVISYQLPLSSYVTLKVFDVLGREIKTLVEGELNSGKHSVVFDMKNLSSGVYFYRLTTPTFSQTKSMGVLK